MRRPGQQSPAGGTALGLRRGRAGSGRGSGRQGSRCVQAAAPAASGLWVESYPAGGGPAGGGGGGRCVRRARGEAPGTTHPVLGTRIGACVQQQHDTGRGTPGSGCVERRLTVLCKGGVRPRHVRSIRCRGRTSPWTARTSTPWARSDLTSCFCPFWAARHSSYGAGWGGSGVAGQGTRENASHALPPTFDWIKSRFAGCAVPACGDPRPWCGDCASGSWRGEPSRWVRAGAAAREATARPSLPRTRTIVRIRAPSAASALRWAIRQLNAVLEWGAGQELIRPIRVGLVPDLRRATGGPSWGWGRRRQRSTRVSWHIATV